MIKRSSTIRRHSAARVTRRVGPSRQDDSGLRARLVPGLFCLLLMSGPVWAQSLPMAELRLGQVSVQAEIAATAADRQQGLMYRTNLAADHGMLFVYADAKPRCFWMRNTLLPLSLAYADAEGIITRILQLQPLDETPRCSQQPSRFALEMNQGWFAQHQITPGDRISGIPD